jgi:hypothetical protein
LSRKNRHAASVTRSILFVMYDLRLDRFALQLGPASDFHPEVQRTRTLKTRSTASTSCRP